MSDTSALECQNSNNTETYNANNFVHVKDITISDETKKLLQEAQKVYTQNFSGQTWYGRCIFLSWFCSIADCTFCYRSTAIHQKKHPQGSRRSMGSALLEALFCKVFNWRIEFLTAGLGAMNHKDMLEYIQNVHAVYGEKIWLNVGVISKEHLESFKPYVKGIVSSIETPHPEIHKEVCPSKPIKPYISMYNEARDLGYALSACFIVGFPGDDINVWFDFIEENKLQRITVYALKPVKGTPFTKGPDHDTYLQWLAKLRIRFPRLEIISGTNLRRSEEIGYTLQAGVNAVTKFPATKQFGTHKAQLIVDMMQEENRNFTSNITKLPNIDWHKEIDALSIKEAYKIQMKEKLQNYLDTFLHPKDVDPLLCSKKDTVSKNEQH
ncbi:MAG: radical SAM protein [Candidatus Woesearchaeota archaeon]